MMGFLTTIDSIAINGINVVSVTIMVTMVIYSIVEVTTFFEKIMGSGSVIMAATDIENATTTLFLLYSESQKIRGIG